MVEQLERGLRPEPSLPERLSALEEANLARDAATKAPNGTAIDLDAMFGDDDPGVDGADGDDDRGVDGADGDRDPFGE